MKYPDAVSETVKTPHLVIEDEEIFDAHVGGKLAIELKAPLDTQRALSIAYTPGVAQVSRAIAADATLAKIDRALGMVDRGDTDGVADTVQQIQAARREVLKVLTLPRERLTALEAPDEDKRPFAAFRRIGR